jgi:septal ring factor EnvC (AmiA/AmiB activator)
MEESHDMDLIKTIEELRREKQRLDRVIASLEELKAPVGEAATPVRSRRGRKSMSPEERREVSARMKRYWAGRLASR